MQDQEQQAKQKHDAKVRKLLVWWLVSVVAGIAAMVFILPDTLFLIPAVILLIVLLVNARRRVGK